MRGGCSSIAAEHMTVQEEQGGGVREGWTKGCCEGVRAESAAGAAGPACCGRQAKLFEFCPQNAQGWAS